MDDLERIRRRKLEQFQAAQEEHQQALNQIEHAEQLLRQVMTKDALQRYGTVKLAHPEIALTALQGMLNAVQTGTRLIDDEMLKNILQKVTPKKRDIKISRK